MTPDTKNNPESVGEPQVSPKATTNPMKEIRIAQISLNIGSGKDDGQLKKGLKLLQKITNQAPIQTITTKRIPAWSLRPGLAIGCKINVGKNKETLLKRLLVAKENILSQKNFDAQGSFSFGIPEYIDIDGMEYDPDLKIMGLEVAVTLERPGFRIKKRKIRSKTIGKSHKISKKESIQFIQTKFNIKVE
ncbi:50S ribosomal protein L5 [Candidatus Woesearchaeota archaeon]|nr:50S ribosomal protein L5 [Candidatus Woesearchaeota archaeon]